MSGPLDNAKELVAAHWKNFTTNNVADISSAYDDKAMLFVCMKDDTKKGTRWGVNRAMSKGAEQIQGHLETIFQMLPKDTTEFSSGMTEAFMSENGPTVFITWGAKDKKNKLEYSATDTFVCNQEGTKWILQTACVTKNKLVDGESA